MRRVLLVGLAAALGSCADDPLSQRPGTTALAVEWTVPAAAAVADAVTIRVEGPTSSTRTASPGESVTFQRLEPGSYVVSVEGKLAGALEWFDETTVNVTAGNSAQARLTARSFQPQNLNTAVSQVRVGETVQLSWTGVTRATSYRVEWDDQAGFASPQSTSVSGTSYAFQPTTTGTFYFRVRAVNRYNSTSTPSAVRGPVEAVLPTFTLTVSPDNPGTIVSTPSGISCGLDCSEDYAEGTSVTLQVGAVIPPWDALRWSGACTGLAGDPCVVTMSQDRTVGMTWGLPLSVRVVGSGTVNSAPTGIDCVGTGSVDVTCFEYFEDGQSVTLSAAPGSGWQFAGWEDDCSGTADCVVVVSGGPVPGSTPFVTARFSEVASRYTLTVSTSGQGTVTSVPGGISCGSDCSETYDAGQSVTLTAAPAAGWEVGGWGGACASAGTATSCQVDMTADRGASVTFVQIQRTLTVTKSGSGAVTSNPAGISIPAIGVSDEASFVNGTTVVLTAVPESGWQISGWGGACAAAGTSPTCQLSMTTNRSASVTFVQTPRTLTVTKSGAGTVVSSPAGISIPSGGTSDTGVFQDGSQVTLTATPDNGWQVSGWGGACAGSGTSSTCQVSMTADRSANVNFTQSIPAPQLLSPANGADMYQNTRNNTFELHYHGQVTGAADYEAQISTDPTFSGSPQVTWTGCFTTTFNSQPACLYSPTLNGAGPSASLALGSYYWRARAQDAQGTWSAWSPVWQFDVVEVPPPPTPTLVSPGDGSQTGDPTPTFTYQNGSSIQFIEFNQIQVDDDPGFGSPAVDQTVSAGVSYTPAAPLATGTYYWRVMAVGGVSTSAWSPTWSFDVVDPTLSVAKTGLGTVGSAPAGISIGTFGTSGSASFPFGTSVTLTATGESSTSELWRVASWGGACAGAGTATTCQVPMNADQSASVAFESVGYIQLSHRSGFQPGGSVTSSPAGINLTIGSPSSYGGPFVVGSTVVLTAQPQAGFVVDFWTAPCNETTVGNTCTFTYTKPPDPLVGWSFTIGWRAAESPSPDAEPDPQ